MEFVFLIAMLVVAAVVVLGPPVLGMAWVISMFRGQHALKEWFALLAYWAMTVWI